MMPSDRNADPRGFDYHETANKEKPVDTNLMIEISPELFNGETLCNLIACAQCPCVYTQTQESSCKENLNHYLKEHGIKIVVYPQAKGE